MSGVYTTSHIFRNGFWDTPQGGEGGRGVGGGRLDAGAAEASLVPLSDRLSLSRNIRTGAPEGMWHDQSRFCQAHGVTLLGVGRVVKVDAASEEGAWTQEQQKQLDTFAITQSALTLTEHSDPGSVGHVAWLIKSL
jgi:hypothetical protein